MKKLRRQTGSFAFAKYQLRRTILENALEDHCTADDYRAGLEFFGGCAFCGEPDAPRKDHLVPVVQCGDFVRQNIVPACQRCDDSKAKREYHDWMLNASSERSLRARGLADQEIRDRIKLIEKWQCGYKPMTEAELFGEDYLRYQGLLHRMEQLCREAKELTVKVRSRRAGSAVGDAKLSRRKTSTESNAGRVRGFVISRYIVPARGRGQKEVIVRAGDVHGQMSLRGQHANVCQALRGDKLCTIAGVKLKSSSGPRAGANAYFTYEL